MLSPLAGTSTGAAGKASPHLQAWLDEKKAAEDKQQALEGGDTHNRTSSVSILSFSRIERNALLIGV